jgi:amino-acid N-acetyltransferase
MSVAATSWTVLPHVAAASDDDVREIEALLAERAPETLPVSADRIRERLDRYHVIRDGGRVAATAALHPVDDGRFELRSVAVGDGFGGRGYGTQLVRALQHEAAHAGRELVCATMSPDFFDRLGFERASLTVVPDKPDRRRWPAERPRVAMSWTPDRLARPERSVHVDAALRRTA